MMELDPNYCDKIIKRWENATGKRAELLLQKEPEAIVEEECLTCNYMPQQGEMFG